MPQTAQTWPSVLSDTDLVDRIRAGDMALFEQLMRRYNERLYRVARAILKSDDDAEDVMQQTYIHAYLHLHQFEGRSEFSTWLTRIAIHEALARRRRQRFRTDALEQHELTMPHTRPQTPDPERLAYAAELRALLERSIDALPDAYRIVFVCREVEGLTTSETAQVLGLGEEAVKTRLHRARATLRRALVDQAGEAARTAFAFHLSRCDAVVHAVFEGLAGARPQREDGPAAPRRTQ